MARHFGLRAETGRIKSDPTWAHKLRSSVRNRFSELRFKLRCLFGFRYR